MKFEFRLPDLGEGMEEAEIVSWLVQEGDELSEDQPFAEVQTDKAVIELPAPVKGRVTRLVFPPGAIVKTGEIFAVFETQLAAGETVTATDLQAGGELPSEASRAGNPARKVKAAPSVRRLAEEWGLDLATIMATGPGGRVLESDLRRCAEQSREDEVGSLAQPSGVPAPPQGDRIALRGARRRMAQTMAAAWAAIPHMSGMDEVDASEVLAARDYLAGRYLRDSHKLTVLPILVAVVAWALHRHPILNSSFDPERLEVVQHGDCNIGMAVATTGGLMVPVIKHADRLGIEALADEIHRLVSAVRAGSANPDDLRGGSFTITNYGAIGGRFATPIIRSPEVAILGFGEIKDRPAVVGGEVVARPTLPFSFSADHRVIDGADVLSFTSDVVQAIAHPVMLAF